MGTVIETRSKFTEWANLRRWSGPARWVLLAGCVLAAAYQLRDSLEDGGDSSTLYFAAKAALRGGNPYDGEAVLRIPEVASLPRRLRPNPKLTPAVYPPSSIVLYMPMTAIPWSLANRVVFGGCVLLAIGHIPALARLIGASRASSRWFVLTAGVLVFGPMVTAIKTKQPSIASGLLLVAAIGLLDSGRPNLTGLALGLSVALKPQLSAPLVVYCAFVGHMRVVWRAIVVAVALNLAGAAVFQWNDPAWSSSFASNLARAEREVNGVGEGNPIRFQLIDVRLIYGSVTGVEPPRSISLAMRGLLLASGLVLMTRARRGDSRLPAIAALLVLGLLIVYHRFYDGILLLLPFAWAVGEWATGRRRAAGVAFLLLSPFLISGAFGLDLLERQGRIPAGLAGAWWWRAIVKPHQVWCLIGLYGLLVVEAMRRGRTLAGGVTS